MQSSNTPDKLVLPFAASGAKNTIPAASQIGITAGKASLTDGFPPLTRTPLSAGGVPPSGLDMNGILYEMSAVIRWANAGGGYPFDAVFAGDTNVGGYPKGARVLRSDGLGYWFNTVDNQLVDPESAGAAAAGWTPDYTSGVTVVTMTGSNVTLTALQYGKPIVIISGTLTANLNLIFPNITGEWTVVNGASGAFSVTCKTAAGTGVTLPTGYTRQIYCDNINIVLSDNMADMLKSDLASKILGKGADLVSGIGRVVSSISGLRSLLKTGSSNVFVTGYYASGDGGGGAYYYDSSDTTSADNGGTIIVATDGGRWKMAMARAWDVSVEQFGAIAGGSDASPKIQAAINAAPNSGGIIRFLGGTYNLASPIIIGNGNGGATPSTKKGIRLIGTGAAFASSNPPTQFDYSGASLNDYLIQIQGQISDIELSGIFMNLNGNIGGLFIKSYSGCNFHNLKIVNPKTTTDAIHAVGGTSPTGNYNIFNNFRQISIGLFQPNSGGLYFDGDYASVNDTWITTFELIRVETVAGATGSTCARMRFIDSCTFIRCHFDSKPEPTSLALVLDATSNPGGGNNYPSGLSFYDCSVHDVTVLETETQFIGNCYFYGNGTNDLEILPNHPKLFGITANGDAFGPIVGFKDKKTVDVNVQNTTVNTSVYSYSIGAYFMGGGIGGRAAKGGIRVKHLANYINSSGANANLTITVSFGGTTLFSIPFAAIPTGATGRSVQLDFTMNLVNNATNAEIGQVNCILGTVGSAAGTLAAPFSQLCGSNSSGGIAIDTSTAKTLDISVQHSAANGSIAYTAKNSTLELI